MSRLLLVVVAGLIAFSSVVVAIQLSVQIGPYPSNEETAQRGGASSSSSSSSSASASQHRLKFHAFMMKFERQYADDEEYEHRFGVFQANMEVIKQIQAADPGAKYGVTKFADLTQEEFARMYLSMKPVNVEQARKHMPRDQRPIPTAAAPDTWDWRDHGAVTPVKNQAQCGSCWSFSATGNMEGQHFLKHNVLLSLSEQQLVDCDHECDKDNVCDQGCDGGLMWNAFTYAQKNGMEEESVYPYTAMDGTCRFNKSAVKVSVSGYTMLSTNEGDMASWCAANGPIAIAINAGWLQFYVAGVSDPVLCDPRHLDHGVLIVGYGTGKTLLDRTVPYWLIKNSWGASWGEKGYFRIKRGDNKCGLASVPVTSVVV